MNKIEGFKIIVIYVGVSLVGILASDLLLLKLGLMNIVWLSILKGFFFVSVTGLLLYKLIQRKMKKIQDREQQLHTLIDAMPDIVIFKDEEGRWIKVNQFGLQLFDLEDVVVEGKTDVEIGESTEFYKEALIKCVDTDQAVWQSGEIGRCEEVIPQKNGEHKTFDTIKVPLFYPNGEKKGLVVIGRDITDRVKIKEQLKESEQLYRSLFENNTDAVFTLDLQGTILSTNESTELITGYQTEELINQSFYEFFTKEDKEKVQEHFSKSTPGKSTMTEVQCLHKEGHVITMSIKDVPIIKEDRVDGFFIIAKDITESKQNEELIIKSEKLSIVGELASAVAHEIRNPLTSLKGFIQLLQIENKEKHQYYDIMEAELDRINSIVGEFMILSKPQAIQFQKEDVQLLLKNVILLLQTIAIMKNVKIKTKIQQDIPPILCEENQLKQVFINILKNAIEAVPEGGGVSVNAEVQKNDVLIRIEDNGNGIPKELLDKLGEPFYTTKEKGTGLGLMVSYRIIQQHHGTIDIQSEENQGTRVDIKLPLQMETV